MSPQVETYSGFRLHERPRRFRWEGNWLEVKEVVASWLSPDQLHFTVKASDERTYVLLYNLPQDTWEVKLK